MSDRLLLGIDAGGTSTLAWLAVQRDGRVNVAGRGESAAGNMATGDPEAALANIGHAIEAAFRDANRSPCPVSVACFALAGSDRDPTRQRVEDWIRQRGVASIWRVVTDAEPLLAHSEPGQNAIAMIAGTGSLIWGRNEQGQVQRCGGWGPLLGDEGSGYWIGVQAIRSLLLARDGLGPPTSLTEVLFTELEVTDERQLPLVARSLNRQQIAALTPLVDAAAARGDSVACSILAEAASQLADRAAAVATRLEFPQTFDRLAVSGGVLLNVPLLFHKMIDGLGQRGWAFQTLDRIVEPVAAALELARRRLDDEMERV